MSVNGSKKEFNTIYIYIHVYIYIYWVNPNPNPEPEHISASERTQKPYQEPTY